jgi:hypothetical protein
VTKTDLRKVWRYADRGLGMERFFRNPGDGRVRPQIPARDLMRAQVAAQLLREVSFHGTERLVRSGSLAQMGISRRFSEDSLAYFDERLDPSVARTAMVCALKRAKRNKAFRGCELIGLAIDGSGMSRTNSRRQVCELCRPERDAKQQVIGHRHELAMISVVGAGISLPFDVEPYGQGDSELSAGKRLVDRATAGLGKGFADYLVADAKFAGAPFLSQVRELGLDVVVALKANVPDLFHRAAASLNGREPAVTFEHDGRTVELWDDDSFKAWDGLAWPYVRVIRYRHPMGDGRESVDAYWLTNIPRDRLDCRTIFALAKSRWEIENQGFNEAKAHHGMEHACRHNANALLVTWLIALIAMLIDRLFRNCYLHRGDHPVIAAIELCHRLWLSLGAVPRRVVVAKDTS